MKLKYTEIPSNVRIGLVINMKLNYTEIPSNVRIGLVGQYRLLDYPIAVMVVRQDFPESMGGRRTFYRWVCLNSNNPRVMRELNQSPVEDVDENLFNLCLIKYLAQ
jgi:hypothetical protein